MGNILHGCTDRIPDRYEEEKMTQDDRETIQRALGILEGAAYGAAERVVDAIVLAVEMISDVLDKEAK